jgi:cell division protein FtsL
MLRRVPSKQRNTLVTRERDRGAIVRLGMLLVCGLVLAGGFVYAGGRHFAALRLGYETEKLRVVLDDARQEQRRLLLEREAAASPARLERAARQLGMQALQPAQINPLKQVETAEARVAATQDKGTAKVEAKTRSNPQIRIR